MENRSAAINVRLRPSQLSRIRELADGRTISELVRDAVNLLLAVEGQRFQQASTRRAAAR